MADTDSIRAQFIRTHLHRAVDLATIGKSGYGQNEIRAQRTARNILLEFSRYFAWCSCYLTEAERTEIGHELHDAEETIGSDPSTGNLALPGDETGRESTLDFDSESSLQYSMTARGRVN